jgi:FkbM family methyltransferase
MKNISWAGRGEDIVLLRAFKDSKPGHYIDIGCARPCEGSVTYSLYSLGWMGLTIDLRSELEKEWKKRRPKDKHITTAVSGKVRQMSVVQQGYRTHLVPRIGKFVTTTDVRTIVDIYNSHFKKLPKFIKIDVEGLEYEILLEFINLNFNSEMFIIEVVDQFKSKFVLRYDSGRIYNLMRKSGYVLVLNDGVNYWFVKKSSKLIHKSVWAPAYPGSEEFIPNELTVFNQLKRNILRNLPRLYRFYNLVFKFGHKPL